VNRSLSTIGAAATALAVLAVGCGADDGGEGDSGSPGSSTEVSSSATSTLAGDYGRTLTAADVARTEDVRQEAQQEAGSDQEPPEPGPLTLTLTDGTLILTDRGGASVTVYQDFSATSDGDLRLGAYQNPELGSFCGPEVPQTASYSWELSGDVLELRATQDRCADRDSILSGAWQPQADG
jgi:hypothetical protein